MKKFLQTIAMGLSLTLLFPILAACTTDKEANMTSLSSSTGTTTKTPGLTTAIPPEDLPPDVEEKGNTLLIDAENDQLSVTLCSPRTLRIQYSAEGANGYRPEDPEYYMVQKEVFGEVLRAVTEQDDATIIRTEEIEAKIYKSPFRVEVYDSEGNLLSKDNAGGIYQRGTTVGVKKTEGTKNAGGIFGFGSGDHGRRDNLNRYNQDFKEFSMSHGRVVAPFFMSTVGYGVFLNTISENTTFFKKGGGFETEGYLDYFFMYGPDFKTILNEYAEITGRMEMYGKWALGFMLSKYGNDNATQAEFLEWIHRLRDEGYPCDVYVFDYGWRGDVNVTREQYSAGQKWGNQMWSNDTTKFPDIAAMFEEARQLGFHVGLHNNAGTPEAGGGKMLFKPPYSDRWVKSYMDSVITTGYGDFFWPDEFDVLGSNTAPVFAALGAYEAWKAYTDASRPMFMTRGSYAGHHYATAWSGDLDASESDLAYMIGFHIDTGLIGYWATSSDLGGFKTRPSNELYTRWVAEFGAWSGMMRTHGHDGREPWTYDTTAQETLKQNLHIRYSLYPYLYTTSWQGYSTGVPMMRAMILEDGSQTNPDAWNLNKQYYLGDWFLVAPATEAEDTYVSVWFPPNTTWYNYYTGERYEGGANGNTVRVYAELEEIPVFVKAGAIVPMGPDVDYADEVTLSPLTLDIYPKGTTTYTLYEDDGVSRKYQTENAYATTTYTCTLDGNTVTFKIGARNTPNPDVYTPADRSYDLMIHNIGGVKSIKLDGKALTVYTSRDAFDKAASGCYLDGTTLLVKFDDTAKAMTLVVEATSIVEPDEADTSIDDSNTYPAIEDGTLYELENAQTKSMNTDSLHVIHTDGEWKGYTGEGFVKPFKIAGDSIFFDANVKDGGAYDLTIRVNCGKKNDAKYDNTNRTGSLYVDGVKVADLSFAVTPTWGDSSKNGDWREYTLKGIKLGKGIHTFTIVAEGSNPGNFNLDSLRFDIADDSVNGFEQVKASTADVKESFTVTADGLYTNADVAKLGFNKILADGKKEFSIRLSSKSGGSITVYETGVGDKILAIIDLPSDGKWQTITLSCKDTDSDPSAIWLEIRDADVTVDWIKFG